MVESQLTVVTQDNSGGRRKIPIENELHIGLVTVCAGVYEDYVEIASQIFDRLFRRPFESVTLSLSL